MSWLSALLNTFPAGRELNAAATAAQPAIKAEELALIESAIHQVATTHGLTLVEPEFDAAIIKALGLPSA